MSEFGASFLKAREALGLSLEDIAVETRISTRFLLAIESEEFERLPGGIFNRGFIRLYAQRVGLDAERAVADYERLTDGSDNIGSLPEVATYKSGWSGRTLYTLALAALVLLIVVFYIVTRNGGAETVITIPPAPAAAPAEVAPTTPDPGAIEQTPEPSETVPAPSTPPAPVVPSPTGGTTG
jgi:cytoskeleton protein RodZ